MSWSISVTPAVPAAEFKAAADKASETMQATLAANDYELDAAAKEGIAAAIVGAQALVESGAIGAGPFVATLSGHANPDHKPVKGWANDCVTIQVVSAATETLPA